MRVLLMILITGLLIPTETLDTENHYLLLEVFEENEGEWKMVSDYDVSLPRINHSKEKRLPEIEPMIFSQSGFRKKKIIVGIGGIKYKTCIGNHLRQNKLIHARMFIRNSTSNQNEDCLIVRDHYNRDMLPSKELMSSKSPIGSSTIIVQFPSWYTRNNKLIYSGDERLEKYVFK